MTRVSRKRLYNKETSYMEVVSKWDIMYHRELINSPPFIIFKRRFMLCAGDFPSEDWNMVFESVRDLPFKNSRLYRLPCCSCIAKTSRFFHDFVLHLSSIKHFHQWFYLATSPQLSAPVSQVAKHICWILPGFWKIYAELSLQGLNVNS